MLPSPWEGPFIISQVLSDSTYQLYDLKKNEETKRTWNSELLHQFYT